MLAKELGVVIPVSFFEEANNAHYNSIAIIDADGTDLGIYRKSHIPDGPGESCFLSWKYLEFVLPVLPIPVSLLQVIKRSFISILETLALR